MRGNTLSAAPNSSLPRGEVVQLAAPVRSPKGTREFGRMSFRLSPAALRFGDLDLLQDEVEVAAG